MISLNNYMLIKTLLIINKTSQDINQLQNINKLPLLNNDEELRVKIKNLIQEI